ncbi:MAG: GTPase HflX [Candidatus Omnitrophica bacterium]|nr:GTPase HflX [Candidatus Omnitrophota bacterium]
MPLPDAFKTALAEERALLIHTFFRSWVGDWEESFLAGELKTLAESAGVEVAGEISCRREKPSPAMFIGKGKAEEALEQVAETKANVVIVGEDLSPTQQRNLEAVLKVKTVDRTQLILDIFASRAQSLEGKLQVELAQLGYLLPRLLGQGILASRLGGGIGTRGPGEQMLEKDRRHIRRRIMHLKADLSKVRERRDAQRKRRRKQDTPILALVGYTSAGKSTLFNRLTGARQNVSPALFMTLDPITRTVELPDGQHFILADTVGFLHRLPHHLVEAFKATLEEVVEADILIHVVDSSHPMALQQAHSVSDVLSELGAQDRPLIHAINKVDLLRAEEVAKRLARDLDRAVPISALHGSGLDALLQEIDALLAERVETLRLRLPHQEMALLNRIYNEGKVLSREYVEGFIEIEAVLPRSLSDTLQKFRCSAPS